MRALPGNDGKNFPGWQEGHTLAHHPAVSTTPSPSYLRLFEAFRRRVTANVQKKGHSDLHTHDIDDAVDVALTWKGPDLGSDRPERVATSTWSRRGPAPNTGRGLTPRAKAPGRPGRQTDEEETWPTTRTTATA
jgi:hypothetical protein